jgi:hypothetical protein
MNKVAALLFFALFLTGCGKDGNPPTQDEIDETVQAVEEVFEEVGSEYKVRGSCNTISDKSHCLDYIGSFWTDEQMQLNCGGAGVFSKNTCPYTDLGGCQTSGGTFMEAVIWAYGHGGQPISKEESGYEAMACNANPMGNWVTPDQIFLNQGGAN